MNLRDPNPLQARRARIVAFSAAAATAAVLFMAQSARAEMPVVVSGATPMDSVIVQRETVRFGDLDLSSMKDAKRLLVRIKDAADLVCGDQDLRDVMDTDGARKCRNDAVAHAVSKVNRPLLTALYDRNPHHA
jgi:UrcA family protein